MTGFDIAVLLLVGAGAVTGFARGFVHEILSLAAWVFAVVVIRALHTPLTEFLVTEVGTQSGASVLGFVILLLVPYAFIKAVARWLGSASRSSFLGPIDRVLGFGFGALKGIIIAVMGFSIIVLGYDVIWERPLWITQARTYPFINAGSEAMVKLIAERRQEAADAEASILEKKSKKKH